MKQNDIFAFLSTSILGASMLVSCSGVSDDVAKNIVINEVMPRNRTGLLNDKNTKPVDWIELKNTSSDSISLKGFTLELVKEPKASKDTKEKTEATSDSKTSSASKDNVGDEDTKEEKVEDTVFEFPDIKIGGGDCLVIFAKKNKKAKDEGDEEVEVEIKPGQTLITGFKLPKKGATLKLTSPRGTVLKELKYGHLAPDQSLALQPDGTYQPTYWQSPGFNNTKEGYAKAMEKMADQRKSPLLINELMTRANTSSENWVELKNFGNAAINLSEYSLSKKIGKKETYWQLPDRTLQPGELITIQLSGNTNPANTMSASIKTGDSETIVLSKGGKFVDGVCGKLAPIGASIGRANGKKGFYFYTTPSRNEENGGGGRPFVAETPRFDKKPGVYSTEKKLCIRPLNKDQKVHYTLNGSRPTADSPILKDSIVITKTTTIRMLAEGDSLNIPSNVATTTYLLGADHKIPVMNITVNHADMYDYNTGIYADGPGYTAEWPHLGGNYFKRWTKNAHAELFDDKEGFSTDCGLCIFGGFSRGEAKKSFRLKFRSRYGDSELDYDFFGNGERVGLKDLVIRGGGQDWNRCMVRDEFFTSLMKETCPTLLIQDYRPVALYINGEYFGLYYMREKIDKHFTARKLDLPSTDSISRVMSKYLEEGTKADYDALHRFVQSNDMTNAANYERVKQWVDVQGLIDYKLGAMFAGNTDAGNIRYVRSTASGSDRKWHFVFYDLDATWVGYKPGADFYLSTGGAAAQSNVAVHNILINRLLANKEFRALFLERLSYHMANTFSPKNTTAKFDALVAQIRPEMKRNCERWPQLSYEKWEKNLEDFKKKFADKPKIMLDDLRQYLHITKEEEKKYFSKLGY